MHPSSLFILFLFLSASFVYSLTTNQTRFFNDLDPNSSISFVNDYLSAIIYHNPSQPFNITSKNQLFSQNLKIVSILPEENLMKLWKTLPLNRNQVILNNFEKGACQIYHPLEEFDVIITSRSLFLQKFRIFRKGMGIRKLEGEYFETSDFIFVDLLPYTVLQVNSNDELIRFNVSNEKPSCKEVLQNFEYEQNVLTAYSILTQNNSSSTINNEDLQFLKLWNSFNINLMSVTNQQLFRTYLSQQFNLSSNSTIQQLNSLLLPSNCSVCKSDMCLTDLEFKEVEYWVIPQICFVIIYMIFLICSGALTQPSLKRRLLTPYLPLLMLYFMFALADVFTPWCRSVLFITVGFFLTFCSLVNVFTYLRLYYLRNLYRLFSNSEKINSILSGIVPGLLFTGLLPFLMSFFVSSHYISIPFVLDRPLVFALNINVGVTIGICCLIGFIVIICDILINRKKWKDKGLRYMLFFDDPFMIRIDMILLSFNLVILILMTAFSFNRHAIYFLRTILFFSFILTCGGQCIIKYLFEKLRRNKTEQESSFEEFMKNDDFRRIQREYCVKELSLENYNFFVYLNELKSKAMKNLTLSQMIEVEKEYLTGVFEVNVSGSSKRAFYKLKKQVEGSSAEANVSSSSVSISSMTGVGSASSSIAEHQFKVQELISIFEMEVLTNLKDTFSRMEKTLEFLTWQKVYKIQKQNDIC
ncbi:predicted protein [Naegleria gruberi]|uniref:Predicted protein n=1 Tax=Naegleria gruberi TaxID=5762 RepID=D2V679_NAEGR|nr:uncharacterized protein NAEGRDRAFT_64339 [Naegleria gruberi]EFC47787.1 predicted protein [Naegleria gruberi]|eukprot:XP_002680531.1 predicted protein [Naegleria gruberi strain NEG-M]